MTGRTIAWHSTHWVGFIDGKPDLQFINEAPQYGRFFKTKKEGLKRYDDVRKMNVSICTPIESLRCTKK